MIALNVTKSIIKIVILGIIKTLGRLKEELNMSRYYIYRFISLWKIVVFFMCIVFSIWIEGDEPSMFFQLLSSAFAPHNIVVEEVCIIIFSYLYQL